MTGSVREQAIQAVRVAAAAGPGGPLYTASVRSAAAALLADLAGTCAAHGVDLDDVEAVVDLPSMALSMVDQRLHRVRPAPTVAARRKLVDDLHRVARWLPGGRGSTPLDYGLALPRTQGSPAWGYRGGAALQIHVSRGLHWQVRLLGVPLVDPVEVVAAADHNGACDVLTLAAEITGGRVDDPWRTS